MKWTWPFVTRTRHEAVLADRERIRGERDQFAKDRDAIKAAAEAASERYNDTAIVNELLTEDLTKLRRQLAASQEVEGALARQVHEMAQPVEPTDAEMDSMNLLIEERDRERRRADHLQRQLDDAVGLPAGRIEDSRRWQPGYKPKKESAS